MCHLHQNKNINMEKICFVILFISIFIMKTLCQDNNRNERATEEEKYRLPKSVIPIAYNINLVPFLDDDNFTFSGDVWIRFMVIEQTHVISLHYNDMDTIGSNNIEMFHSNKSITPPSVLYVSYNKDTHKCDVNLGSTLTTGTEYTIRIKYKGYLRDDMEGFFRSSYVTKNGQTRWLAATHLEPFHARRMFPCFDEPAMKAKFNISVARTSERQALSNMPVANISDPDPDLNGMIWDHFEETPVPLSPHTVAIIVSDFDSATNENVTIWERPDAMDQAKYGLVLRPQLIKVMEDITKKEHFLPKFHVIAVPDYNHESSGQFGLGTYRERFLLYDENFSTAHDKQNIAMAMAQEVSRTWFGNLISSKWWDYVWINEGYAGYFKYHAIPSIENDWRMEEQFVVKHLHKALAIDSVNISSPLTRNVLKFDEIMAVFDDITYYKGPSIIRMLKHMVTPSTFFKGTTKFLNSLSNSTAEPDDLYASMQAQFDEDIHLHSFDVKTVMDTWTLQMGYPVVTVTRNYDTGIVTVEQGRFLLEEAINGTDTHDYKWWIPLTYTTQSVKDFDIETNKEVQNWIKSSETSKDLLNIQVANDEWIIFNIQQTGFYRVNYDDTNWKLITKYLNSDKFECIPPLQRAQILDDGFNLARAGYIDYKRLFDIIQYLEREVDYIPWYAALSGLSNIERYMRGSSDDDYQAFKDFALNLIDKVYNHLGFEEDPSDDHVKKLHRNQIMKWACDLGKYDCVKKAQSQMAGFISNGLDYNIYPDMKSIVFCNGLRYGGEAEWEYLWNRFLQHDNVSTEEALTLEAIGCSQDENLIQRYMASSLNKSSEIRQQDKSLIFPSMYNAHGDGIDFTINFLLQNYRQIKEYHNSEDAIVSLIESLSSLLFKETQLNKLRQFVDDNKSFLGDAATKSCLMALEVADKNLNFFEEKRDSIVKQLKDHTYRLPKSVTPLLYTLKLDPYFQDKNFSFNGEVEILINVTETTNRIVLNSKKLDINKSSIVVISSTTGLPASVIKTVEDDEHELFIIKLESDLVVGHKYIVSIVYSGYMGDDLVGLYRSSYTDGNEVRWLAATQLETTYARYVLPCFDELSMKAPFRTSVARNSNYSVLANMPLTSSTTIQTEGGDRIVDTFQETPIMTTYLLAFIISDFTKTTSGIQSVWQRPGASSQATYSISISQPIVSALESFLEVQYELPKLDQVAVPDISAVAMENWGLITYRESYFLYDDKLSSASDKQVVALQIAHEIAHQWFGNLVSPKLWYYAWLNEGFAFYFQFHALAKVETSWQLEEQFILHGVQKSFGLDAYYESRPMTYKVDILSQIPSIFDIILYEKAGSVIRMIAHAISNETFRKGLNKYLTNFSHGSADSMDLSDSIKLQLQEELKDIDIEAIVQSWSTHMGYPVVTVKRNYESGAATISQERFIFNNIVKRPCDDDYIWWIPISYTTKSNADFYNTLPKLFLNTSSTNIENLAPSTDWVIFNLQESGYYRVNYDTQNWKLLASHLNSDNYSDIHMLNRAQIVDDALNLARAGDLDYSTALDITTYLPRESEYIPWYSALTAFTYIENMLKSTNNHKVFENYTMNLIKNVYNTLGTEGSSEDDHITKLFRLEVLKWLCKIEETSCVQNSTEKFGQFMSDPENKRILADIAPVVYCTALASGGETEWNFLYNLHLRSNVEAEQVTILTSLGCSKNTNILQRYLDLIISGNSPIKTHLKSTAMKSIYNNPVATDVALNLLTNNYNELSKAYAIGNSIDEVIAGVAQMLTTQTQIDKMKIFLQEQENGLCDATLSCKKALSIMDHNNDWIQNRAPELLEWLNRPETTTGEPDSVK